MQIKISSWDVTISALHANLHSSRTFPKESTMMSWLRNYSNEFRENMDFAQSENARPYLWICTAATPTTHRRTPCGRTVSLWPNGRIQRMWSKSSDVRTCRGFLQMKLQHFGAYYMHLVLWINVEVGCLMCLQTVIRPDIVADSHNIA